MAANKDVIQSESDEELDLMHKERKNNLQIQAILDDGEYEKSRRLINALIIFSTMIFVVSFAVINLPFLGYALTESDSGLREIKRNFLLLGMSSLLVMVVLILFQYLKGASLIRRKVEYGEASRADVSAEESLKAAKEDLMRLAFSNSTTSRYFDDTLIRMSKEVSSLGRRGNVNLLIGVATTLVAVAILSSTIFFDASILHGFDGMASHFLPRVSLSIFIEIFSFFFLKLYSAGLQDIKYYQNEMTNFEAKFIALNKAIEVGDKSTTAKILISLSLTERNGILKKGETTQDIERLRQSQQNEKELLSALMSLVKTKP
ncbi:hypothetical protein [Chromobacterium piscinae]|uniref:hypothetical protein n=1 Tax=Chromobacterium piscinae TaxID=686831 RepID=UPI003207A4EB